MPWGAAPVLVFARPLPETITPVFCVGTVILSNAKDHVMTRSFALLRMTGLMSKDWDIGKTNFRVDLDFFKTAAA